MATQTVTRQAPTFARFINKAYESSFCKLYAFKAEAVAEAVESYGAEFAESVLGRYDVKDVFAPLCGDPETAQTWLNASQARHVWADMLEEIR